MLAGLVLAVTAAAAPAQVYDASNGVPAGAIHALARGFEGNILVGTDGGLARYTDGEFEPLPLDEIPAFTSTHILSLQPRGDRALFVGTSAGVVIKDRDAGWFHPPGLGSDRDPIPPERDPVTMIADVGRSMWLATPDTLYRGRGPWPVEVTQDGQHIPGVRAVVETSDHFVWIAGKSLLRVSLDDLDHVLPGGDLPPIEALATDGRGGLWAATHEGLFQRSGDELVRVAPGDFTAILAQPDGDLWVAGPGGLFHRGQPVPLPAALQGAQILALVAADDGALWVAGRDAVARLPGALPPVTQVGPTPTLLRVLANGRDQTFRNGGLLDIAAPNGRAAVDIVFGATRDASRRPVFLRYRLEGHDPAGDWTESPPGPARYPQLAPGRYRFRVQLLPQGGAWATAQEATLTLVVHPPFYQTTWFRLSIGGALAALAAAAYAMLAAQARRRVALARASERMAAYARTVAGVAHEVRQPLFALTTVSYVLSDRLREHAELTPQLQLMSRELRRISAMTDDLMELARPPALLSAPTRLEHLFTEAIETFRAEGASDVLRVDHAVDPAVPEVNLDRARMLQVLLNLLQNARHHADGVTRIDLRARRAGDSVVIDVENDGARIPAGVLPHIFEPFYTGGRGTGLGLAIARAIIEAHGGTIDVSSDGPTRFTIRVPLTCSPA